VLATAFFPNQLKWIPEHLPDWNHIPSDDGTYRGWQFEVPSYGSSEHESDRID